MNADTAQRVRDILLDVSGKLDASVALVQGAVSEEEFRQYRRAIAGVMGALYFDALRPLFREHPDLEPASFKPRATEA